MPDADWTPAHDERGDPIPITYLLNATNETESTVGTTHEFVVKQPVSEDNLRKKAEVLAAEVSKMHPDDRPWVGWIVSVEALNLYSEPAQVCRFEFPDLLNL